MVMLNADQAVDRTRRALTPKVIEAISRHRAFFEALDSISESHPDWFAMQAGVLVLRLVDEWLAAGSTLASDASWRIRAVNIAVDRVPADKPARAILSGIVAAIDTAAAPDARIVAPQLMAYARSLDYEAKWSLAVDVYRTIASHVHPSTSFSTVFDANMRLGYCLRMLGDLTNAELAYAQAKQVAVAANDAGRVLHARVGEAAVAHTRGNLPLAESTLDEIIVKTDGQPELDMVRGLALHDRSFVAHSRGHYEQAIRLAYQALPLAKSLTGRDRVLGDIAHSFLKLGVRGTARDAFLILAATAQERYVRWAVTINLLEIAALDHSEPTFWQHQAALEEEALPGPVEAHYRYILGQGLHAFGRIEHAQAALARAKQLAEDLNLNQLSFQVDDLSTKIAAGQRAEARRARQAPAEVEDVATAISEMKELVGAAA
jgi:tetratricopeptide (TPR) repeat protein